MNNNEQLNTSPLGQSETETLEDEGCKLMLYNDGVHSFDYVIKALIDICRHTVEQAEQCSILVKMRGKCIVKRGSYDTLLPMHTALLDKQLTSEIIK
ncbi:MAG: ATP-dependent Clp protease adaptor ClpS [Bacteroidales bacterium]|nr:ATP-dependent Clp protease adaptor ClpS [Bacteroidales bacterium]